FVWRRHWRQPAALPRSRRILLLPGLLWPNWSLVLAEPKRLGSRWNEACASRRPTRNRSPCRGSYWQRKTRLRRLVVHSSKRSFWTERWAMLGWAVACAAFARVTAKRGWTICSSPRHSNRNARCYGVILARPSTILAIQYTRYTS